MSQKLAQRVTELAERYETPLPNLSPRVAELEVKVKSHLDEGGRRGRHGCYRTIDVRCHADKVVSD